MIPFNIPPYIGTEEKYITEAIKTRKICGDGEFTKKDNAWLERNTKCKKALLTSKAA